MWADVGRPAGILRFKAGGGGRRRATAAAAAAVRPQRQRQRQCGGAARHDINVHKAEHSQQGWAF